MYHKIIGGKKSKGQRNIKKSIEYLLREKNTEQQKDIKILSTTTKQDLINFENYILDKNKSNPYVCGVLSFEEKSISEELKTKLITEFEDILFAGIEQENRPPVMWVEHNDKGRVELNYLTFNSLQDRRSYTVYLDKRDRGLVNNYSEIINYENNLSSPFEEKENKNTLTNKPKTNIPEDKKQFIENINTEIMALIINEELENRDQTIKHIENMKGVKINRIRKNQISIKSDLFDDDKPIVLKGDIYEEGRDYSDYRKEFNPKPTRDPEFVREKLTELKRTFAERIEKREIRNRSKFKKPSFKSISENRQSIQREDQNIGYKYTNSDFINVSNNDGFSGMYIRTDNMEIVNNESINTEYKTKTATEETAGTTRTRDIEKINQQQQFVNSRLEEAGRKQQQFRKSIDTTEGRFGVCRRSVHSIISTFGRYIRTFSAYTKKNEHRQKFEKRRKIEEEKLKIQNQGSYNRRRYKPH
ncbi:hypothetical protein RZQ49_31505 [Klebsiella michiganensis]|uniref:hypothetical protein n=1 Tax=Klebsiella michiganensis TaxID=1134687 RepID=UPI00292C54FF|nr:hypothetical protein [Klebsiella michiganensis]MDV1435351.1 hypothetical protein [Klebsiella michiganensis]